MLLYFYLLKNFEQILLVNLNQHLCSDIQSLSTCTDIAYTADCQSKALQGLCNTNLADSQTVRYYCQKSCGLCGTYTGSLTCSSFSSICGVGQCQTVSNVFGISTIRCVCPTGYYGAYCQRR